MLGKLLKYELRATARTMLPIFGVMLLVSALANVTARLTNGRKLPGAVSFIFVLIIILFAVGLMAIGLVTVFMMVRRFRDNLLRDEGYIMHTLPVSVHAHIWSKVIVSALWYALAGVTVVLSVLLVAFDVDTIKTLGGMFSDLLEIGLNARDMELVAEALGLLILASMLASLSFDAALSIGHAFAKNKMGMSVLVFIILLFLGHIVTVAVTDSFNFSMGMLPGPVYAEYSYYPFITVWRTFCVYFAGIMLVEGAACYALTAFFLKRKLNLE